jgi:hypothetical protein
MASVRAWSQARGFDYRFVGDAIFDGVPGWYLDKSGRGPVATDYGRLILLQDALDAQGYEQAIWLDVDVFVMDKAMVLACDGSCAFGQETWIQAEGGSLKARRNVHNAVCLFRRGCVVLPFLAETVLSIIRRVDADHVAPQMVGPKLLSALHSLYAFDLLPQVGAISPAVAADLMTGGGEALELLRQKSAVPLQAVNLCASLISPVAAETVIGNLRLLD